MSERIRQPKESSSEKWITYRNGFFIMTILCLPLYMVRFSVFGLSENILDILLVASIIASFLSHQREMKQQNISESGLKNFLALFQSYFSTQNAILFGSLLLFFGVLISFAVHPTQAGLGIIKSWFILPFFTVFLWAHKASKKEFFTAFYAFLFSSTIIALVSLWYWLQGNITFDGRLRGLYLSPNHLAMIIAPAIILDWLLIRSKSLTKSIGAWKKSLFITVFFLFSFILYQTFSYSAWIACAIGILTGELFLIVKKLYTAGILQKTYFKKIGFSISVFFLIALLVAISVANTDKFHALVSGDSRSSFASRIIIWHSAWDMGKDHWIFGIGPGNFQERYLEYQKFYPPYLEWAVPQPHNLFLAFWLQTGLVGLLGFFTILYEIFLQIKKVFKKNTASDKDTLLSIIVLSIIVSVLAHGFIDTPYWKNDLSVLWWLWVFALTSKK